MNLGFHIPLKELNLQQFIIKHLYERPRPEEALRLITEDGYSFPSGHATAVTALLVSLVLVLTTTRIGRRLRHLLWAAALTLIVFICVTRLYLGVHWVTDVIAGFSVGLGSSMIFAPFMIGPIHGKSSVSPQTRPGADLSREAGQRGGSTGFGGLGSALGAR